MASSSQPPPLNPPPSATSTSPPTSATTSTVTTAHQASTVSPPAGASTANSSVSSPPFPAHGPVPHNAPPSQPPSTLSSTLPPPAGPSASSQRQIAEARQAVLASIGNMLDAGLRDRAGVLHGNAAAIARQERDVARATDALRRENDRLARVAGDAARRVKELGNVQNWAEVLESDFLAIEETIRLVREGSTGSEGWSGSGSGSDASWSGSESGDEREGEGDGDVRMCDAGSDGRGEGSFAQTRKGKGKEVGRRQDDAMDVDGTSAPASQTVRRIDESLTGNTTMGSPGAYVPPVVDMGREAPSIKFPGAQPSQTSTISLEDELRIAMDQPIGV